MQRLSWMRSRAEKLESAGKNNGNAQEKNRGEVTNLFLRINLCESLDDSTPREAVFEPFANSDSVNKSMDASFSQSEQASNSFHNAAPRSAPRSPCKKRRTFDSSFTDDMDDSHSESSSSSHMGEVWMDGLPRHLYDSSSKPIPIPKSSFAHSPHAYRDSPLNSLDDSRLSQNNTLLRSPNNSMSSPATMMRASPAKILGTSPSHFTSIRPSPPWDTTKKSPIAPTRLFADESDDMSVVPSSATTMDQSRKPPLFPGTPRISVIDGIPNQNPFRSPFSATISGANMVPRSNGRFCREFAEPTRIGSGSFGEVFKAIKRLDLCAYAVKIVPMRKAMRYYLKEVQALATQTENPFMVRYFDCWVEDDKLYILFELCDGTLADRTQSGPQMSEPELCRIACNALMGLHIMHENNLAHLDIKPANLYMSQSGVCKIGDLGLVAPADAAFEAEDGDNRYLCPDLLQGTIKDLRKADIFSLGATLYELARWSPLPGTGDEYHAIRTGNIPFPANFNIDLAMILSEMMQPSSKSRPNCAELLARPFFAPFLRGANFSEVAVGMTETAPKLQSLANALKEERLERIRISEESAQVRSQLETVTNENSALRTELEALRAQLASASAESMLLKNRRLDFVLD